MNLDKAKSVLKINPGEGLQEVEDQYRKFKAKYTQSIERATNTAIKANFESKLAQLEEAKAAIDADPKTFVKQNKTGFQAILANPLYVAAIFLVGLLLVGGLGYFEYNRYMAKESLAEGLVHLEEAMVDQDQALFQAAIEDFDVAIQYGSEEAMYQKGHVYFLIGQRDEGVELMGQAIEAGFDGDTQLYYTLVARMNRQ